MTNPLRPAWLTARPIAHRGLHDATAGVTENSIAAAQAAIAGRFAIECDVQISADGEAMVFHDFTLDRLTGRSGRIDALPARALAQMQLATGGGAIPSLDTFLDMIAGRVPLVIEIKSAFNGDMRLCERVASIVAARTAPLAIKSFDPAVMTHLRRKRDGLKIAHVPLGMVAEAGYTYREWAALPPALIENMKNFLHWEDTRPDFLSWHVNDLPHPTPHLLRTALELPVMTWTVRTQEQRARAKTWADQMIFEGWTPE